MKKRVVAAIAMFLAVVGLLWHENFATAQQKVRVSYIMSGETVVSQEIDVGTGVSVPALSAPDGYFISGYQLADGSSLNADTVFTDDASIYVILEPYSQTVAEKSQTEGMNGSQQESGHITVTLFYIADGTYTQIPGLEAYTQSVTVTADTQGKVTMPVITDPQGLILTGYIDENNNTVNAETVFLKNTNVYAQYDVIALNNTVDTMENDDTDFVSHSQFSVTIHYAGLVTSNGQTYYDYDDSYICVCYTRDDGTIELPVLSSYAGMTYMGLMDEQGDFVTADTVYTQDTSLYAVYDYEIVTLADNSETVSESAQLPHVHGGSSANGGACYSPVYHTHTGNSGSKSGCYQGSESRKSESCPAYSGWDCWASGYGSTWNHKCRVCGSVFSSANSSTHNHPGHNRTVTTYGLSCGKSTSTVVGYNLNCSATTCGTVTMVSSNTQDNAPNTVLSCNLSSSGAGAVITAYRWSNGETTENITVTENGNYRCDLTYQDAKSKESGTVTVAMTVNNIDSIAPTVTVSQKSPVAPTNTRVILEVSATDNVAVSGYSMDGKQFNDITEYEVTENGVYTLYAIDPAGNVGKATITVSCIDKLAPDISPSYNNDPTNKKISIEVIAQEQYSDGYDKTIGSGMTYSFDGGSFGSQTKFTVAENRSYVIKVKDLAGNVAQTTVVIGNYDTQKPVISSIEKSSESITNKPITLTVNASDTQNSGYTADKKLFYSIDGSVYQTSNKFTVSVNGTYTIYVKDLAGNVLQQDITVENIDLTPPETDHHIIPETAVNGTVTVRISAADTNGIDRITDGISEAVNTGSGSSYEADFTYEANGTYEFSIYDRAGNEAQESVTVSNIDILAPIIRTLEVTDNTPQNRRVTVRASADEQYSNGYNADVYGSDIWYSWQGGEYGRNTTYSIGQNGEITLKVKDLAGNENTESIQIHNYDAECPIVDSITQNNEKPTKENIVLTIGAHDEVSDGYTGATELFYSMDGENYQSDNTFEVTENGTYIVYVKDLAGNITSVEHKVTNIERTPPEITFSINPDECTNGQVSISVTAHDVSGIALIEGNNGNISGTETDITLVYEEAEDVNGSYRFTATDQAGNQRTSAILIENIDTLNPVIQTIREDVTVPTNQPIILSVEAQDQYSPLYNINRYGSSVTYEWDGSFNGQEYQVIANGTYVVKVTDLAGNASTQSMQIHNYDAESPIVDSITQNNEKPTKENIVLTIGAHDEVSDGYTGATELFYSIDGENYQSDNTFEVTENGTYTVYVKDLAGNVTSTEHAVSNIDRQAPLLQYATEPDAATNSAVQITVTASDDSGIMLVRAESENVTGGETDKTLNCVLSVTENGTYHIYAIDGAGNESSKEITIDQIDTELPVIEQISVAEEIPCQKVSVSVEAADQYSDGYNVLYGTGLQYKVDDGDYQLHPELEITTNGVHTIYVKDLAGNVAQDTVEIHCIDVAEPKISTKLSTSEMTNKLVVISVMVIEEVSDGYSGSVDYEISFDGVNYSKDSELTVTRNGRYMIYARDLAGNIAQCIVDISNIKNSGIPADAVSISLKDTKWTKDAVRVVINVSDPSIASNGAYSFDGGNSWQDSGSYDISENGDYEFCIKDVAGNVTRIPFTVSNIDHEQPIVEIQEVIQNKQLYLYVTADDMDSGLPEKPYSWDNEETWQTEQFIVIKKPGTYRVAVCDKAGNIAYSSYVITQDMLGAVNGTQATVTPTDAPASRNAYELNQLENDESEETVLPEVRFATPTPVMPVIDSALYNEITETEMPEEVILYSIEDEETAKASGLGLIRVFTDFENMTPQERTIAITIDATIILLMIGFVCACISMRKRSICIYGYDTEKQKYVRFGYTVVSMKDQLHTVKIRNARYETICLLPRKKYAKKHIGEPLLVRAGQDEYKLIIEPEIIIKKEQ